MNYLGKSMCKSRKPDIIFLSKEFFESADIDIEVKARVIYERVQTFLIEKTQFKHNPFLYLRHSLRTIK